MVKFLADLEVKLYRSRSSRHVTGTGIGCLSINGRFFVRSEPNAQNSIDSLQWRLRKTSTALSTELCSPAANGLIYRAEHFLLPPNPSLLTFAFYKSILVRQIAISVELRLVLHADIVMFAAVLWIWYTAFKGTKITIGDKAKGQLWDRLSLQRFNLHVSHAASVGDAAILDHRNRMRYDEDGGYHGFPRDEDGFVKIGYQGVKCTDPEAQKDGTIRIVPVTRWTTNTTRA